MKLISINKKEADKENDCLLRIDGKPLIRKGSVNLLIIEEIENHGK